MRGSEEIDIIPTSPSFSFSSNTRVLVKELFVNSSLFDGEWWGLSFGFLGVGVGSLDLGLVWRCRVKSR
jgi:hypothetical protein